ncbi:hypothetical protein IKP85_03095 [bacterium]|nr:hypothetical protein [bacterium]
MKLKLLGIMLSLFLFAQTAISAPFNANAKTKRIPAGTQFTLELMSDVTSTTAEGTGFSAILVTDQKEDKDVILPSGSLVRGTVRKIVPSKRLSRGAVVYLDFDHVVTPNGRQLPLSLSVIGRSDMTIDGGITTTKGYGDAVKENWNNTKSITKKATQWGVDTGNKFWNGYGKILTVPTGAIGGGIGGGAYFVGDSTADLIRKGKEVQIEKGSKLQVILVDPIDVPVI